MPVYKDKETNTWRVLYRYRTITGETKQTQKRGFTTKREALLWEREQALKAQVKMNMTFASFIDVYTADKKNRLKLNTWLSKEYIIKQKLLPYFGHLQMDEIGTKEVLAWQNAMINYHDKDGKPYSQTYLKTMHNQLSAVFNHAVKYYNLPQNPVAKVGAIGKKEPEKEMLFWTKEEYLKFAEAIMDKPLSYYAFEMLYWCGLRVGELLALTASDFDWQKGIVRINKSYQRLQGKDIITEPKTPKSKRNVKMPDFLTEEIREYLASLYGVGANDRIFPITKSYMHHEMERGCLASGVKKIRIHDLRHSHVSLLIEEGFSAVAIGDRVGHESIDITFRYAHLFPTKQEEIANKLNRERGF